MRCRTFTDIFATLMELSAIENRASAKISTEGSRQSSSPVYSGSHVLKRVRIDDTEKSPCASIPLLRRLRIDTVAENDDGSQGSIEVAHYRIKLMTYGIVGVDEVFALPLRGTVYGSRSLCISGRPARASSVDTEPTKQCFGRQVGCGQHHTNGADSVVTNDG